MVGFNILTCLHGQNEMSPPIHWWTMARFCSKGFPLFGPDQRHTPSPSVNWRTNPPLSRGEFSDYPLYTLSLRKKQTWYLNKLFYSKPIPIPSNKRGTPQITRCTRFSLEENKPDSRTSFFIPNQSKSPLTRGELLRLPTAHVLP